MKQAVMRSAAFLVAATVYGVATSEHGQAQVAPPQPAEAPALAELPSEAVLSSIAQPDQVIQPRRGSLHVRSLVGDVVEVTGPLIEAGDVWAFEPNSDDLVHTFFSPDAGLRGPVTLYAGFEAAEGFNVAAINGQQGWTSSSGPSFGWASVLDELPFSGERALRIGRDANFTAGTNRIVFSPNLGPLPPGAYAACLQIQRPLTGTINAAYDLVPQAPSQGFLTARLRFAASDTDGSGGRDIWVLDNFGSGLFFFATGLDWTFNTYHAVQIELDAANNTMDYFLDGKFIHRSIGGAFAGTTMENFVFVSDNRQASGLFGENARIDEVNFGQGDGGCPAVEADDCNSNGVRDYADIYEGTSRDCNNNGIPDECDIANGTSSDCDDNGIPDECEQDCNSNGIVDGCDVADSASCQACYPEQAGQSDDCQGDGVPDECQLGDHLLGDPLSPGGVTYEWGDGIGESSLGSSNADFCWFNHFTVAPGGERLTAIRVAYGTVPESRAVRLFVLSDPDQDGDPFDSQPLVVVHTQVTNPGGAFNTVPIPDTLVGAPGERFFVGACCRQYLGDFPAVLDTSSPSAGKGWISENFGGLTDLNNIYSATIPPAPIDFVGLPGNLLIGAEGGMAENDCNMNFVPDDCDLASGWSSDVDSNGRLDECDPDCNSNGVADGVDILMGTSLDCNGNETPDECDTVFEDCNTNGVPDECDLATMDCNNNGVVDECEFEKWVKRSTLTASGGVQGNGFPRFIAMSNDTIVAGAVGGASIFGRAYVFVRSGGFWVQGATLSAFDQAVLDFYGGAVATDGNFIIVGAQLDDHAAGTDAGSAYVYSRAGGSTLLAKLIASDAAAGHRFGSHVAVDGDTAVIAAFGNDYAYVFRRIEGVWIEEAKLFPPTLGSGGRLTGPVAIQGDTLLATGSVPGVFPDPTVFFIALYARSGDVWTEQDVIITAAHVPLSASMSGKTAIVGATGDCAPGVFDCGRAYIIAASGSPGSETWSIQQTIVPLGTTASSNCGVSVGISGETAVIGCNGFGDPSRASAHVYERSGGVWTRQSRLNEPNTAFINNFGIASAVAGDFVVVGDDTNSVGNPSQARMYIYRIARDCNQNQILDECETFGEGDYTGDGSFTLDDMAYYEQCMPGPDQAPMPDDPGCSSLCREAFDLDGDGDVDLADFAEMMLLLE